MAPRVGTAKRVADSPVSDGSATKQSLVEKHDSGFVDAMQLFASNPTNQTFVECRYAKLRAIPEDYDADSYTFMYRGTPFGLILSSQAQLQCNMTIRRGKELNSAGIQGIEGNGAAGGPGVQLNAARANHAPAGGDAVWPIQLPLRLMWKSKDIYINDDIINTNTNADDYVSWVRHLSTEIKKDYADSDQISMCIHPTPSLTGNRFHENILSTQRNTTNWSAGYTALENQAAAALPAASVSTPHARYSYNRGGTRMATIFNNGALVEVIDSFDGACFNENGVDKYIPSDFNIKIVLNRNSKIKYLNATTEATGEAATLQLRELSLKFPMFKPKAQLAAAINHLMVTKEEEVKYYHTQYRLVARHVAAGAQTIRENDIFNGALPTRLYTILLDQRRYNGQYIDDKYKFVPPNIQYFCVRVNNAIVHPELRTRPECYMEWRRVLNREYREMPFTYPEWLTNYGAVVMDLTENKDSYNEVLPNATNGVVNIELNLKTALGAAGGDGQYWTANNWRPGIDGNAACIAADGGWDHAGGGANVASTGTYQLLLIGEFRNEKKIGFNSPGRSLFDF